MDKPQDEFGRHVYDVLGADDPDAAAHLLAMRSQFQNAAAADAHRMSALSAEQLNARNQRFLDEATALLGPDRFEEVFGISAGETINLVLPDPTTDERHPPSGLPFRTVP